MSEKEGRQSGSSPQASAVTVSDIQELIRRKEEIEAQIKANYDVLESVSVSAGLPGGVGGTPRPPDSAPLTRGTERQVRPPLERPSCGSFPPWEAPGVATAASVGSRQ